jgi:hypothetical protein
MAVIPDPKKNLPRQEKPKPGLTSRQASRQ